VAKFSDVNNIPATGIEGAYRIKEVRKAAGWTVVESSDGTTFSAGNGDTITSGGTGAGGFDRTLAWIRVRDPGGRREETWQRIANNSVRIKVSESARFTTGIATATRTPAATDEIILAGGGTDTSPTGATNHIGAGTNGNYRLHCIAMSTPEGNVYPTYYFTTTTGTGAIQTYVATEPMKVGTYHASNASPLIYVWGTTGPFSFDWKSNFGILRGWYRYGFGNQFFQGFFQGGAYTFAGGGGNFIVGGGAANPYNGADDGFPVWIGRPVGISHTTTQHMFGMMRYIKWKTANRAYPNTINSATDGYVYINEQLWPYADGVTPLV
jgi:hypothetical protein